MLKKSMRGKQGLIILIGLMMISGQAGFLSLDKVYAQEDSEDAHTVFVGTDRHGSGENLVNIVQTAESDVENRYDTTITKTVHAGDLVDSSDATSTLNSYTGLRAINGEFREALPQLAEDGSDSFYTYGYNHDQSVTSDAVANHFLDSAGQSGSTSPTRDTGVKELGDWGYLWGIDHFEMTETAKASAAAAVFTDWVNGLAMDDHRVILIASHVPLHSRRGDNEGAAIWLEAINAAAEDNDIVFFWGHNHTGWGSADQRVAFVAPGGSIQPQGGSTTEIDFTYELAGYIGKSATNAWRGSAITVEDETIYVDHYSTSAHTETKEIERKDVGPSENPTHNWSTNPIWKWAGDDENGYTAATATFGCEDEACDALFEADAEVASEKTDPTCTKAGSVVYTATVGEKESPDGQSYTDSKTVEIPATGHKWENPTYEWKEDNGIVSVEAKRICAHDASHVESETVVATSEITKKPSCTEEGEMTYTSAKFENSAFAVQTKVEAIKKLEHTWDEGDVTEAATCKAEGTRTFTCTACGDTRTEVIPVDPDAHHWDEGVVVEEPKCDAEGVTKYVCTLCETEKREAISKTGHMPGQTDKINVVQETCTTDGSYDEVQCCSVCGAVISSETITVPATGHKFPLNHVEAKAATCTEDGTLEYWKCEQCDCCFEDEAGEKPLAEGSWIVTSPGHQWDNGVITKKATCTAAGTRTFTCSACDVTKTVTIKATGHSWKHYKKAAGLLKDGTEYDYCTVCKIKKNVKTLKGYATYYVKNYSVARGKASFTAKWTKRSVAVQKKFSGYQIRYSLKSTMAGAKYARAKKSSSYKKISKLKKKTKYYVQVRTYTIKSGKTYYSKWSTKKAVTTK